MTICTDYRILYLSWQGWQQRSQIKTTISRAPFHPVQDAVCGTASTTALLKVEGNIRVMTQVGTTNEMFKVVTENRGLWNHFTNSYTSKPRAIP